MGWRTARGYSLVETIYLVVMVGLVALAAMGALHAGSAALKQSGGSVTDVVHSVASDARAAVAYGAPNLAPDPITFSSGWIAYGASTHLVGVGSTGGYGGWQTQAGDGGTDQTSGVYSQSIPVTSGATYTISVWIDARATSGSYNSSLYIQQPGCCTLQRFPFTGTAASFYSVSYTVPSNISAIDLFFSQDGAIVNTGSHLTWAQPSLKQQIVGTASWTVDSQSLQTGCTSSVPTCVQVNTTLNGSLLTIAATNLTSNQSASTTLPLYQEVVDPTAGVQ